MIRLLNVCIAIFLLLIANEWWFRARRRRGRGEISRKLIHMTVGSFVAFWPYFLSWTQIVWLSAAFLVVVIASKTLHLFAAIHQVSRRTWGEVFFAIVVGAVTFVTHDKAVYAVAILHMSLADGLAAMVGTRFGERHQYKVLGATKSLAGTVTFILTSLVIMTVFTVTTGSDTSVANVAIVPVAAALVENFGVFGLDNLLVPMLVAVVLSH
jgi:phytol kinase